MTLIHPTFIEPIPDPRAQREFRPCDKCRSTDVYINYHRVLVSVPGGWRKYGVDCDWQHPCTELENPREHFHLSCRRCHYQWQEEMD